MSVSILIVDDEPDVAELFRQCFRREAREGTYVLHFAASGEQALERLADEIEPQLIVILSDINMPGMDGLTLLQQVKQRFPDLPVMMVTAYGDDERRRRAAENGATKFITKPIDFYFLKEQLRQLRAPFGVKGHPHCARLPLLFDIGRVLMQTDRLGGTGDAKPKAGALDRSSGGTAGAHDFAV